MHSYAKYRLDQCLMKSIFLSNNIHNLSVTHMLYFENMIYIQPGARGTVKWLGIATVCV